MGKLTMSGQILISRLQVKTILSYSQVGKAYLLLSVYYVIY